MICLPNQSITNVPMIALRVFYLRHSLLTLTSTLGHVADDTHFGSPFYVMCLLAGQLSFSNSQTLLLFITTIELDFVVVKFALK
jgi:hypothetical protein